MKTQRLGILVALTMFGVGAACSSSSGGGSGGGGGAEVGTDDDAGAGGSGGGAGGAAGAGGSDGGKDAKADTKPKPDAKPDAITVPADKTTGLKCTKDDDCDKTMTMSGKCGDKFYAAGSHDPTPVCYNVAPCELKDGFVTKCDGDRGVCRPGGATLPSFCVPKCEFDGTAKAPSVPCEGKNGCVPLGWGTGPDGVFAIGICSGGCKVDADCAAGDKCQKEIALCVKKTVTASLKLGDSCTPSDRIDVDKGTGKCSCYANRTTKLGYCTQRCKVGDTDACPDAYTCDPGLPAKDKDGKDVFTGVAVGLAGSCLKNCTSDDDCTALNGYCSDASATKVKVCVPGKKPM